MRIFAIVVALCAAPVAASAEAPDAPAVAVTLREVVTAVAQAPSARVTEREVTAATALVEAAGAWPAPTVRAATNRLTARLVIGATLPLPIFGTVGALRRESAAQAEAVRSEALVTRRDLRRRAVLAWIALSRAGGDVTAAAIAATQAAEIERIARGRLDAGVGADVDVTAARAARARADLAAARAKRGKEAASAELAGVLGWDPLTPLEATGPLPGTEPIALEALRGKLSAHPERTVATRRIAAAEATLAQVRSLRYPTLSIEGGASFADPTTPGTDVTVGLALDLPLFSRIGARARSAEATAAAARARLAVTETELGAGLVASYRRWQAATETLHTLEQDVVPAQERAATLSQQAYREGARDLESALQANRDLTAVRAEVNAARADVAQAWAELQVAAGDDLGGRSAN